MDTNRPGTSPEISSTVVTELDTQAADLCGVHNHITAVIEHLNIEREWFDGYEHENKADDPVESLVRLFIYQHARGFTQSQLERRLRGAAFVYMRFDLSKPPSQAFISYNWKNRFTLRERQCIEAAAERIYEVCVDHGVERRYEPAIDPADVNPEHSVGEEQIRNAVRLATELGFDEFSAGRASNYKYPLKTFFERQGFMCFSDIYTTSTNRIFKRASYRAETPHGSTHNRTMKKVATPPDDTTLWDYVNGHRPPKWKRIRDHILPAFHAGVEKQLDEIAGRDRDGIRQPVHAALDITTFPFQPSPFRSEDEVSLDENPVVSQSGREVYPKDDYPEMVSGFKDRKKKESERGYKFATLTIVGKDTPVVIAVEPVRDERWWEKADDTVNVERTSRAEVVERLLEQATQHVEINKLFCDREFDIIAVRDIIAHWDGAIQYVIGKKRNSEVDGLHIEEIIADPVYDSRIEYATCSNEGRTHKLSIIYLPGNVGSDSGGYSIFTVNGWVDADRAQALVGQYRERWMIENQYKSIKEHFLPQTASKDYRIRFLYFVIGVVLHNVWRLANFVLRDMVRTNLGDSPPLMAKEVVQLISKYLIDPGDPPGS